MGYLRVQGIYILTTMTVLYEFYCIEGSAGRGWELSKAWLETD